MDTTEATKSGNYWQFIIFCGLSKIGYIDLLFLTTWMKWKFYTHLKNIRTMHSLNWHVHLFRHFHFLCMCLGIINFYKCVPFYSFLVKTIVLIPYLTFTAYDDNMWWYVTCFLHHSSLTIIISLVKNGQRYLTEIDH